MCRKVKGTNMYQEISCRVKNLSEVFDGCYDLSDCKYILVSDTRLCHLLFLRGGKVKAGCSCLLPYVQKLVAMQCDELGFRKNCGGILCKAQKCKASLHEVKCHPKNLCIQQDLAVLMVNLSKLVIR